MVVQSSAASVRTNYLYGRKTRFRSPRNDVLAAGSQLTQHYVIGPECGGYYVIWGGRFGIKSIIFDPELGIIQRENGKEDAERYTECCKDENKNRPGQKTTQLDKLTRKVNTFLESPQALR